MKLKNIILLNIVIVFILSFPIHFIYEIIPNFITSILFPINESLFEHMKIIFTSYILSNLIIYKLLEKINLTKNHKASIILSITYNILIFLVLFYPIYLTTKHNLIVTLTIYFISIVLTQLINYHVLKSYNPIINKLFIPIIVLYIIIFAIFTYYPLKNNFFIDYYNNKIGFSNY